MAKKPPPVPEHPEEELEEWEKMVRPRKISARELLSKILIFTGIAMIVFALGYEAHDYPWKTLFGQTEKLNSRDVVVTPSPILNELFIIETPTPRPPEATPEPDPDYWGGEDMIIGMGGDDIFGNYTPTKPVTVIQLGTIEIPKLNVSEFIFENYTKVELALGTGHLRSSPLPGEAGNVIIAGHRSTAVKHPFKHLRSMSDGDKIYITDNDGNEYTYQVTGENFIVTDRENWVMGPVKEVPYCMTLITCHPYGRATHRVILRAGLVEVNGKAFDGGILSTPLNLPPSAAK